MYPSITVDDYDNLVAEAESYANETENLTRKYDKILAKDPLKAVTEYEELLDKRSKRTDELIDKLLFYQSHPDYITG